MTFAVMVVWLWTLQKASSVKDLYDPNLGFIRIPLSVSFLPVSLINYTVRRGFSLFHKGPGLLFHSSHTSDLNLQCSACFPRCTPPCESTPPLPSLTRIASILALVKLTSSLNYANKAIVICICTGWWHVALGVGGRQRKKRWGGDLLWYLFAWQRGANQSAAACKGSSVHWHGINKQEKNHIPEGSHCASWQNGQPQGPVGRSVEHFSTEIPPRTGIYGLETEWLVQVQSTDNCSALPLQYITGLQTSARVSTRTTLII